MKKFWAPKGIWNDGFDLLYVDVKAGWILVSKICCRKKTGPVSPMGVKSFITQPPFHEKFLSTITRPHGKLDKPILAPPLSSNYQLVGIAFDYLLRFHLERINPGSKTSVWAAEEGVLLLYPFEGTSDKYERAKVIWTPRVICISHLSKMAF